MGIDDLIKRCKKNDIIAQEQLYKIYAPKLFSICLKYSPSYAEAQDNLQDSFLLIFEKIRQFEFKGSFDGWIKKVVINYILQQFRSKRFLSLVNENIEAEEETQLEFDESISMAFLTQIIQELPERYRLVFNLSVFENYTHQEIATALEITVGTSKSNLSRAKTILKEKIENNTGSKSMPSIQ